MSKHDYEKNDKDCSNDNKVNESCNAKPGVPECDYKNDNCKKKKFKYIILLIVLVILLLVGIIIAYPRPKDNNITDNRPVESTNTINNVENTVNNNQGLENEIVNTENNNNSFDNIYEGAGK